MNERISMQNASFLFQKIYFMYKKITIKKFILKKNYFCVSVDSMQSCIYEIENEHKNKTRRQGVFV